MSPGSITGQCLTETVLAPVGRVMSLKEPHLKMSKSHQDPRSRIHIIDEPDIIYDKVKLALTDSISGVSYDPETRPGISNLLVMMSHLDLEGRTAEQIAQACNAMSMRDFKAKAAIVISESLAPMRDRYYRLMDGNASSYLRDVAMEGTVKACGIAKETVDAVRSAVGLT